MTQSLEYISKAGYKHVHNNHKRLRFNQIKDLKETESYVEDLFKSIQDIFENKRFEKLTPLLMNKQELLNKLDAKIAKQVERTRSDESSPKNTALYFSLLLETKDLLTAIMNLIETYEKYSNSKVVSSSTFL